MNKNILILPITAHTQNNAQIYEELSKQLTLNGFRNVSTQMFPAGSDFCLLPSNMSKKDIIVVDVSECTSSNIQTVLLYCQLKTVYLLFPHEKSKEVKRMVHEHSLGAEHIADCQLIEWNGTKDRLSDIARHINEMERQITSAHASQRFVSFLNEYFPKVHCLRELSNLTSKEWYAKQPKRNDEQRQFLFHNHGLHFKPEPAAILAGG